MHQHVFSNALVTTDKMELAIEGEKEMQKDTEEEEKAEEARTNKERHRSTVSPQ